MSFLYLQAVAWTIALAVVILLLICYRIPEAVVNGRLPWIGAACTLTCLGITVLPVGAPGLLPTRAALRL
jgi:hypothetical protein